MSITLGYFLFHFEVNVSRFDNASSNLDALYTSLKSSSISFLSVTRTLAAIFLDICTRHL